MDITKNDIRLFLYKPNRDSLGEITVFLNPQQKLTAGKVNELTFTLPYYIEENQYSDQEFKINKNINKYFNLLRERYQLKVQYLGKTEWYIIDDITKTGDENGNEKQVKAYSLQYELRGERLFNWGGVLINGEYRKESITINQILDNLLKNSSWNVGEIDTDLLMVYRRFDFSDNLTLLEALYEVQEAFECFIVWDTENRLISFYPVDKVGKDLKTLVSYKKYLKMIQDEIKPNDIITRLIPVGKDGIQINGKNPTGASYLQDYSYWMQPFQPKYKKWSDLPVGTKWSDL